MPSRPKDRSPGLIEIHLPASVHASDPPSGTGTHAVGAAQRQAVDPVRARVPPPAPRDHIRGDPHAARILIEYGDYQCPNCAAAENVVTEVLRRLNGGLMQVFRHFPVDAIHPMATPSAETAEFAAAQGEFWAMHGALMAHTGSLSLPELFGLASELGHPVERLGNTLSSGTHAAKVIHDFALGLHGGVRGTPTFFIDGALYEGPVTAEALVDALN